MLVLVNADNPTHSHELADHGDAKRLAEQLGWTATLVVEADHATISRIWQPANTVPQAAPEPGSLAWARKTPVQDRIEQDQARFGSGSADPIGDVVFAHLVKDGHVYECRVDDEAVTVTGRESSIACPRDALDGE